MNIYKPNLFNIKKLNINKSFYRCNTNNLNSFQNSPININQKSFIDLKRTKNSKNKKKNNLSQEIKFNKKLKLNNSFFYSDINSYSYRYKKNYYNNNNSLENIKKKLIKNKIKLNYNLGERKYKKKNFIKNNKTNNFIHKNKNNSAEKIFYNNNDNNHSNKKNLLKNTSFLNITENNYNIHVNNYISKNNNNSNNKKNKNNNNNFNILELKKFNLFNFLNYNISESTNNSSHNNKEIKYNLNDLKVENNNNINNNIINHNINNNLNNSPEEIHFFFVKLNQKNKNILNKIN